MAETLRIEIPIETIDNTDPELSKVAKGFEKMEKTAENANSAVKKAGNTVTQFDKQAEKTERTLSQWAKEKYEIMLEAKEKISPVLTTLGNGLRSFTGKTWNVTMKAIDLITTPVRGIINLLKNPIFQAGAILGVSISLKDTVDTFVTFEATMSKVKAISGATGAEMEALTQKAKIMGADTKFSATESGEAFTYMAMAGWNAQQMLDGIGGIMSLSAADGLDLATTSDIVTDALTAFGLQASESGHFADVLATASSSANTNVSMLGESFKYVAPVAGAMKYSVEDISIALGLMANASVKGSMAGTALKTSIANMASPTKSMADAMKKYKISLTDSNGEMKSFREVIDIIRGSLGKLSETQQTAAASTIFGKEAMAGMLAIVNASEVDYQKLTEAIDNADGAADNMAETMMDNLAGAFESLEGATETVKLSLGERLKPYLVDMANWLEDKMPTIEKLIDQTMDTIDKKVTQVQKTIKEFTSTDTWNNADLLGKVKITWDEIIGKPFSEWWNTTGKAKIANFAQDIGTGIGTGLKIGIMALLGIDIGETVDEGVSIGASFAKGFSDGFDFGAVSEKIWQGLGNMLTSAGKLLPGGQSADLSSIISAVVLGKIASPLMSMGKGTFGLGKSLFGTNADTGTSLMGSLLGSAATGTGLLGKSSMLAIDLGAGNLTGGASMSTGALSATGLAAGAGAIAAGATLVSSALDAYKAITSDSTEEKAAYGESAAWKAGGVAAGAAAGAAIGSIIPGIGTAVGALVGAGVGGIAGWIKGNKIKEEYHENVEKMQKEAEKAQKIFEATGLSIEDVKFKNEVLTQAMNDSAVSAEQFALMFQEECANVAIEAFGNIKLSLEEVKKVASSITFADMADGLSDFAQASADTESALNGLKSSVTSLKKENWKVGLGMELTETDMDRYKNTIDNFVESAQTYINDNHYEAAVALRLLTGENGNTTGLDNFYEGLKNQIGEISTQLSESTEIFLSDGVITLDEEAELENLQNQILEITNKLAEAQTEAQFQTLQIKYNGAALDANSFNALQEELQANVAAASEQYDSALTVTLTSLNLQLSNGAITQEEYNQAVKDATDGYYAQINGLSARVTSFNLESIASAFETELVGLMPGIQGSAAEKLTEALNNALVVKPDVSKWTTADVISWMGLDKLNLDSAQQTTIATELIQTALAVPEGTKETILKNFKDSIPTTSEIMEAVDFTKMTWDAYTGLTGGDGTYLTAPGSDFNPAVNTILTGTEENFEERCQKFAENIQRYMEANLDPEQISDFMAQYMNDAAAGFDFQTAMQQYEPISNESYETLLTEYQTAGTNWGNAMNTGVTRSLLEGSPLYRSSAETAVMSAFANPFNVTAAINITPSYTGLGLTIPGVQTNVSQHAAGGYVSEPELSWLAEEGYGEFVIPTNPSRRSRALELYEQAGRALGIGAHAEGGIVGSLNLGERVIGNNLINESIINAPRAYNETIDGKYNDDVPVYTLAPADTGEQSHGRLPVQVNVSMEPEFIIQGGNAQSEEDIMQVIRRHMKEMADELGGEIAGKLEEVFSNMPMKKEA